jgi:hypothetical protein
MKKQSQELKESDRCFKKLGVDDLHDAVLNGVFYNKEVKKRPLECYSVLRFITKHFTDSWCEKHVDEKTYDQFTKDMYYIN